MGTPPHKCCNRWAVCTLQRPPCPQCYTALATQARRPLPAHAAATMCTLYNWPILSSAVALWHTCPATAGLRDGNVHKAWLACGAGASCATGVTDEGGACVVLPDWAKRSGPRKSIYWNPKQACGHLRAFVTCLSQAASTLHSPCGWREALASHAEGSIGLHDVPARPVQFPAHSDMQQRLWSKYEVQISLPSPCMPMLCMLRCLHRVCSTVQQPLASIHLLYCCLKDEPK